MVVSPKQPAPKAALALPSHERWCGELADVDADDLGHVGVLDQPLDHERAPPSRDAGDQDSSLSRRHSSSLWACRPAPPSASPTPPHEWGGVQLQYVRLMTSRSIRATAFDTVSSSGDFACRSANSSWRSSEYSAFIALIASPMSTFAGSGMRSSGSPD